MSFTQDTGPAFTCTAPTVGANGTITCSLATLAAGASATFTLVVNVDQNAPAGTINNTATGSTTTGDPTPGNNSATEPTTVIGRADLSITKTGSPSPVTAGNNLTYTITVTNTSTAANGTTATGITVSDSLPANTSFVSVTGHDGFVCTGTRLDQLHPGQPGRRRLGDDHLRRQGRRLVHRRLGVQHGDVATTGTSDPDPTDDSDTETTPVSRSAEVVE